eukprot:scaffold38950_cov68-Phaeocystis_antarctica.AAC.2
MRASTLGCRFLDRCGCRLGVEISFKDMCILAAVLTVDAELIKFGPVLDVGGVADDSAAPVRRERGRRGRAAQAGAPPGHRKVYMHALP